MLTVPDNRSEDNPAAGDEHTTTLAGEAVGNVGLDEEPAEPTCSTRCRSVFGRAKRALRDMYALVEADAERGIDAFLAEFEAKYPKATACLAQDRETLLAFFGFPAEHWRHLRKSNVIESLFATVRLRQRVTKGAGSRRKGLLMAYKLVAMAQRRWRRLNGGRTCCPWSGPAWFSSMASSRSARRRRIGRRPPDHVKGPSTTFDNSSSRPVVTLFATTIRNRRTGRGHRLP